MVQINNTKMIEELKYLIDANENNPKIKKILLDIAKLDEKNQYLMIELIKNILLK